jgi:hypothetical protein
MVVRVLLPDLSINTVEVSNTNILNASEFIINYSVQNSGNYHSGSYDVRYYVAQDSILESSDYCIGSKAILFHDVDSIIMVEDTLALPTLDIYGNMILIVKVDAEEEIIETDETNNTAWINLILNSQICEIPQGWSGLSSYFNPVNDTIESIFGKVSDDLIILQNNSGSYWPSQQINTLTTWGSDQGYQIKVSDDVELAIQGTRTSSRTLQLTEGWNLIPVISECNVDLVSLFANLDVVIAKEVAGWNIFWPGLGINTLGVFKPGKAYFVLMNEEAQLTFPECNGMKTSTQTPLPLEAFAGLVSRTASTHTLAIPKEAVAHLSIQAGTFIKSYDLSGQCFGIAIWQDQNSIITLFGDDPLTQEKEGFTEGEQMIFKVFENGIYQILVIEYDQSLPNADGLYQTNGLSAIKSATINNTSVDDISNAGFTIYPNPADEILCLNKNIEETAELSIISVQGIVVYVSDFAGMRMNIDTKGFPPGIYFVKLKGDKINGVKRLVIK